MNIVFYIRALYEENFNSENERSEDSLDGLSPSDMFKKYSRITPVEYRQLIHQVQIKYLNSFTSNIIINKRENNKKSCYNFVQQAAIEKLVQFSDDTIVIPIDDDDWISPNILTADLNPEGITVWAAGRITAKNGYVQITQDNIPKSFPLDVSGFDKDSLKEMSAGASCQAISMKILKPLLLNNKREIFNPLLQRHGTVRTLIRKPPIQDLKVTEKIISDKLSIYVRNAYQLTLTRKARNKGEKLMSDSIKYFKNLHEANIEKIDPEFNWALSPLINFIEINKKI